MPCAGRHIQGASAPAVLCSASDPHAAQLAVAEAAAEQLPAQTSAAATAALVRLVDSQLAAAWPTDALLPAWRALVAADPARAVPLLDRLVGGGSGDLAKDMVDAFFGLDWRKLMDCMLVGVTAEGETIQAPGGAAGWFSYQQAEVLGAALLDAPGATPSLLAASIPSAAVAGLLALLQLQRGGAVLAWELLRSFLRPVCSADADAVQQVVAGLYAERQYEQARLGQRGCAVLACFLADVGTSLWAQASNCRRRWRSRRREDLLHLLCCRSSRHTRHCWLGEPTARALPAPCSWRPRSVRRTSDP